jgi:hypothetical protein
MTPFHLQPCYDDLAPDEENVPAQDLHQDSEQDSDREGSTPVIPFIGVTGRPSSTAAYLLRRLERQREGQHEQEAEDVTAARNSLAEFIRQGWHVLEPDVPLSWSWLINSICDHVQAVLGDWHDIQRWMKASHAWRNGEGPDPGPKPLQRIQNLVVNVPPGTGKSRIVSVYTPAWMWLKCPSWRAIFLSASDIVALRDSIYCRELIGSDWYQDTFKPDWHIPHKQDAAGFYRNSAGGWRRARPFLGRITGDRADCVRGETLVETECGPLTIQRLHEMKDPPRVWSYNHTTQEAELKRLVASRVIQERHTLTVRFRSGHTVCCTAEHRIWVGDRYQPAEKTLDRKVSRLRGSQLQAPSIEGDTVVAVTPDRHGTHDVYDIQVEGNHNFFANGILVHNCLMVDDPHDAGEVNSDKQRQAVLDKWDSAIFNRVNDLRFSVRIGIMQRLHMGDWTGHVLNSGAFHHLCMPVRFEPDRLSDKPDIDKGQYPRVTPIGWSDPRIEEGEMLFEERYPAHVLEVQEKTLGPLAYAGQYQQHPTPAAGNLFKAAYLCPDDTGKTFWGYPTERITEAYLSFDTATKEKTQNDYTAGCISLLSADGIVYVVPLMLERIPGADIVRRLALYWAQWKTGRPVAGHGNAHALGEALKGLRIEENSAGAVIVQYARKLMVQRASQAQPPSPDWTQEEWDLVRTAPPLIVHPYNSTKQGGDKFARAMRVIPFVEGRNVRLVGSALSPAWLQTLQSFPLATNDDAVDATVAALERFAGVDGRRVIIDDEWMDKVVMKPGEIY